MVFGLIPIATWEYYLIEVVQSSVILVGLVYEYKSLVKLLKEYYPDRYSEIRKHLKYFLICECTGLALTFVIFSILFVNPYVKFLPIKIYDKLFKNHFIIIKPTKNLQVQSVNKTIKNVKMGNVKLAEKLIRPAINYLLKQKCKKIILGCTELPIAIFAFKSFTKVRLSKKFFDPNLILAISSMAKYKK